MPGPPVSATEYRAISMCELGVSDWFEIDQSRIDTFGDATLDRQYIHVDPVAAESSPFGGTVAHGFLTLSLLTRMLQDVLPSIEGVKTSVNYGFNSIRFVAPVRSGRRIRGRFVLKGSKERSPSVIQSTFLVTVEIENEPKPALVAEWLGVFYV